MIYKGKEITPGLERISLLMERAGHPEDDLQVIHIAGTNGKGSTGAFIVSILRAAGYRTGHFHTPALHCSREEIQVDGAWISEEDLGSCERQLQALVDPEFIMRAGEPSPFEMETAAAFLYFSQKKCSYAVMECGMGGRLDATNIVRHPAVSVLASISMDHMDYLGNTLQDIAMEKCGIIKYGCPVAADGQQIPVRKIIEDTAASLKSPLSFIETDTLQYRSVSVEDGQYFDYAGMQGLHIHNTAAYQPVNAALAITAVMQLTTAQITEDSIREGLEKMRWPARFEVVSKQPLVIYDGAHNPDAVRELTASIQALLPNKRLILIMGVLADKDYLSMLQILSELPARFITFAPRSPRALSAVCLADAASAYFEEIYAAESLEDAWEKVAQWRRETRQDTAVIQCGTLSAYADFCSIFTNKIIRDND